MSIDILITVAFTSFIQSIFGVGVLLFGTPLLLLQGYNFINAVIILLPISVSINLIQIVKDYRVVDRNFYTKILIYTIPSVVIFLFVVTMVKINIGMIIGVFLLFVSVKDYSQKVNKIIKFLIKYEKTYFLIMGTIHGLTNLGGSLLTAIVHSKNYEKHTTRVTVAASYATFAVFQILTLLISGHIIEIRLLEIGIYLITSIAIFLFTEIMIYMDINNKYYHKLFAVFLFISGALLCVKSI